MCKLDGRRFDFGGFTALRTMLRGILLLLLLPYDAAAQTITAFDAESLRMLSEIVVNDGKHTTVVQRKAVEAEDALNYTWIGEGPAPERATAFL